MTKETGACRAPDVVVPQIDREACEGKEDCIRACPYDVFELRVLTPAERTELSFVGRVKGFFHGYRQAFAVRAEACHACGACVRGCPEQAITLVRVT